MALLFTPQRFEEDFGGVFYFVPKHGIPDATPNIVLYNPAGTIIQASAAMTAGTSTTFNAASGASETNPYSCNVTSSTGFLVGEPCVAVNGSGQSERVEVYRVATGLVTAKDKLAYDYASTHVFKSQRYKYTISSTHAATSGKNFRAQITYAVNSVSMHEIVPFHVKKHVYVSQLREEDLYRAWRDLREYRGFQDDFNDVIGFSFDEITSDLAAQKLDIDLLLPGRLEVCQTYKALHIIALRHVMADPGATALADRFKDAYDSHLKGLTEITSYYDSNEDGISDTSEADKDQWYRATPDSYEHANPHGKDDAELSPEEDIEKAW